LLVFVMDAIYTVPYLLLAIIFAFLLGDTIGSGIVATALSLVAIYIPQYFRVVRNTTVSAREATYVEAARAIGAKPTTIMRKYLFGNVVQSVPVIGTLNAADSVGTLAALGFLGLGIQPTEASEWGYDLSRALDDAQAGVWWPALWPGLAIVVLITALTLVGEGLNETLNPALRRRRLRPVKFNDAARPDSEKVAAK
jgi:peptide/nickel transport system permease protein